MATAVSMLVPTKRHRPLPAAVRMPMPPARAASASATSMTRRSVRRKFILFLIR